MDVVGCVEYGIFYLVVDCCVVDKYVVGDFQQVQCYCLWYGVVGLFDFWCYWCYQFVIDEYKYCYVDIVEQVVDIVNVQWCVELVGQMGDWCYKNVVQVENGQCGLYVEGQYYFDFVEDFYVDGVE